LIDEITEEREDRRIQEERRREERREEKEAWQPSTPLVFVRKGKGGCVPLTLPSGG
jgi:hypothetical protein